MSLCRYPSSVRAVCVNALVRICAGGDQRWSFLPTELDSADGASSRQFKQAAAAVPLRRALGIGLKSRLPVWWCTDTILVQRPRTNSRRACPRRLPAINVAFTCHNSVDDKSATRGCALRLLGSAIRTFSSGSARDQRRSVRRSVPPPMVRRIYKDAQSNIKGQKHTSESASGFCRVSV